MLHILQTGDLHLGKILYEYSLLDDQKHMLDALVQELHSFDYDVLIITGDIYDRSIPSPEAVSLFDNFLTRLHTEFPQLPVCFISGNHDSARRLSFGSIFFRSQNIHICTEASDCTREILLEHKGSVQAALYQMPFLQAGTLTAKDGTLLKSQQELAAESISRIQEKHKALQDSKDEYKNLPALLNCHVFTIGGDACDSERIFLGTAELIRPDVFAPFAYTAAGHLHKKQKVSDRLYYAGSPLAYSFSETQTEKCFLRIELGTIDGVQTESMPSVNITPIAIAPLRRLIRIESTFEKLYRGKAYAEYEDDFIEFICTDTLLIENVAARLRERFTFLLSVKQKAVFADVGRGDDEKKRHLLEKSDALPLRDILFTFLADIGLMSDDESAQTKADWALRADLFEKIAKEVAEEESHAAT